MYAYKVTAPTILVIWQCRHVKYVIVGDTVVSYGYMNRGAGDEYYSTTSSINICSLCSSELLLFLYTYLSA